MTQYHILKTVLSGIILFVLCSVSTWAVEPADSNIKSVLDDLTRYEQQFSANTRPSKNTVNRTLKLLTISRQRLDGSAHKDHASWLEADRRHTALVTALQAYLTGSTPAAPATSSSPPPAPSSTSQQPAAAPSGNNGNAASRQLISQDLVRLKKLKRDIESATDSVDTGGVKPFQDAAYIEKFSNVADRHRQSLARYADVADHPDVMAAAAALENLDKMIEFGKQQGAMANQELGDVQARLAEYDARLKTLSPPAVPQELDRDNMTAWLQQSARIRQAAAADFEALNLYREKAYLPDSRGTVEQGAAFDMQNVDSMQQAHRRNIQIIDDSLRQLTQNFDANIRHIEDTLNVFSALDPTSRKDQQSGFLGEGNRADRLAMLDRHDQMVAAAQAYHELTGSGQADNWKLLAARLSAARLDYQADSAQALKLVRMPEAATDDGDLEDVAEDTLENPKYGVGEIERLVINADKTHHTRESSEVEYDEVDVSITGKVTLSGTQTTTFYEWDQFQVATVEQEGDQYFIYYNTLKYFTSGASTTPQNKWILSNRFRGTEILEDNIDE